LFEQLVAHSHTHEQVLHLELASAFFLLFFIICPILATLFALFYEIPQITQVLPLSFSLSRSLSLKNKHRLTGNVGYGRNRRHKKRKPEMERVGSGTDNSFVVAIVGNL